MTKVKLPKWFDGKLYSKGGIVRNTFTGQAFKLNAVELSMYDYIMGAHLLMELGVSISKSVNYMRKGLTWFKKNNPEAYYVLLDYLNVTDDSINND